MNVRDMKEVKRMWGKDWNCCDRYAMGYLDGTGGIAVQEGMTILSEPAQQYLRHMELIKKIMVMDLGNRIKQVSFQGREPEILDALRDEKLRDVDRLEAFFSLLREALPDPANHVILLYHGVYDITRIGTDEAGRQEQEKYESILCLVCPARLAKAKLAVKDGKPVMTRTDKVIGAPKLGFIWPAFDGRAGDPNSMVLYHASPDKVPHEVWKALGLQDFRTTAQIRREFQEIFQDVVWEPKETEDCMNRMTEALGDFLPEYELDGPRFAEAIEKAGISAEYREKLVDAFVKRLEEYRPNVYQLMDPERNDAVVKGRRREWMRSLLFRAAGVIEGTEAELARQLRMVADRQG